MLWLRLRIGLSERKYIVLSVEIFKFVLQLVELITERHGVRFLLPIRWRYNWRNHRVTKPTVDQNQLKFSEV